MSKNKYILSRFQTLYEDATLCANNSDCIACWRVTVNTCERLMPLRRVQLSCNSGGGFCDEQPSTAVLPFSSFPFPLPPPSPMLSPFHELSPFPFHLLSSSLSFVLPSPSKQHQIQIQDLEERCKLLQRYFCDISSLRNVSGGNYRPYGHFKWTKVYY